MSESNERIEQLVRGFEQARPKYKAFTTSLRGIMEHLTDAIGLHVVSIDARTKELDSFREKVSRSEKYETLDHVTDLSGVRIITFLQEDVERIGRLIGSYVDIDPGNSGNKDDLLAPDQFGYRSLHYIVSYKQDRCGLPEFTRYRGMRAEIQVRTALQHAWAAIDHRLRYKTLVEAPKEMKRTLYRISALLECADEDFSRVTKQATDLLAQYRKQIDIGDLEIELNQESLELFICRNQDFPHLQKIARDAAFHISPRHPNSRSPYLNLLLTLHEVEINRVAQLDAALRTPAAKALAFLADVHRAWQIPGRAPMLVIDLGGLLRLLVLGAAEPHLAMRAAEEVPFGPALQTAVRACLTRRTTAPEPVVELAAD